VKIQVTVKNPDAIHDIVNTRHPMPSDDRDITPRMEEEQEAFAEEYFEYGDYMRLEIDTETMSARILPRKEWK
jgi:hypothetical protein